MISNIGGSITALQIAAVIVLLYAVQLVLKAIYRITLHPLAKFPGPTLAALTYKYEFYFDGIKGGRFTKQIQRLHQIYGTRWPFSLRGCTNSLQGQLFALTLRSCTAMTRTFSIRSSLAVVKGVTNRVTLCAALATCKIA